MSEKEKKSAPKENLTWKINYLAAQVGETTHMKTAIIAASRTKYHKIHSNDSSKLDTEALKQELYNARKLKLETKLHQARREIKAALKKGKSEETKKQIKKIKSARKLLEEKDEAEKLKKKITAEDIEQYEKELEILKEVDIDKLVEKTIKNKLVKNTTLKNEPLIKELIETHIKPTEKQAADQMTQNIESRLISQKSVVTEVTNTINSFLSILLGDSEKIEKRRAEELKKKKAEEEKKRKAEELEKSGNKKSKVNKTKEAGSSEFIETLGADVTDDENEDENFKKIYEGEKKPNRQGQRARRKQWEEMYGREANHIAAEFKKREEKRLANPDYKPKKKPTPKPQDAHHNKAAAAEPVHPSWEAKRIQEEIMSKALSGKGTSNNKIVFDDSD